MALSYLNYDKQQDQWIQNWDGTTSVYKGNTRVGLFPTVNESKDAYYTRKVAAHPRSFAMKQVVKPMRI